MENIIALDKSKFDYLLNSESNKIVGKVCKRLELLINSKVDNSGFTKSELNLVKAEIKELIHEHNRDFRAIIDILTISKEAIKIEFIK